MPNNRTQKERDAHGKRYSEDEKVLALRRFGQGTGSGLNAKDAANFAGASVAQLYRWRALERENALPTVDSEENLLSLISNAVKVLVEGSCSKADFILAAIVFSVWLARPYPYHSRSIDIAHVFLEYNIRKFRKNNVCELENEYLYELQKISIAEITALMRYESDNMNFFEAALPQSRHSLRQIYADLARFFIASPESAALNFKRTKTAAYNTMANNGFCYNWSCSMSSFNQMWAKQRVSWPYLYVEEFESDLSWDLNPIAPDLIERIDYLSENRKVVLDYFGRCKWAAKAFNGALPKSRLSALTFPDFPASVVEIQCDPIPLSTRIISASKVKPKWHTVADLDTAIQLHDKATRKSLLELSESSLTHTLRR